MKKIKVIFIHFWRKVALTPEQADTLATIKFPCC